MSSKGHDRIRIRAHEDLRVAWREMLDEEKKPQGEALLALLEGRDLLKRLGLWTVGVGATLSAENLNLSTGGCHPSKGVGATPKIINQEGVGATPEKEDRPDGVGATLNARNDSVSTGGCHPAEGVGATLYENVSERGVGATPAPIEDRAPTIHPSFLGSAMDQRDLISEPQLRLQNIHENIQREKQNQEEGKEGTRTLEDPPARSEVAPTPSAPVAIGEDPLSPRELRKLSEKIWLRYQELASDSKLVPAKAKKGAPEVKTFLAAVAKVPFYEVWDRGFVKAAELLEIEDHGLHRAHCSTLWRLIETATKKARQKGAVLWVDAISSGLYDNWFPGRAKPAAVPPVTVTPAESTSAESPAEETRSGYTPPPPKSARLFDRDYEACQKYDAVCEEMKKFIKEQLVMMFVGKLDVAEVTPHRVVLVAPNQHYIDWISQQYIRYLHTCFKVVFGRPLRIFFAHREQTTPDLLEVNLERLEAVSPARATA